MSMSKNLSPFYPPPPYKPLGRSYSEWSKKWYEWVQFIRKDVNPATDSTGMNCSSNQRGPVWFLAGTTGVEAKRSCTVPAGKDIFLSIINEMSSTAQYGKTGQDLIMHCNHIIDQVTHKEVIFDGQILKGVDLDAYKVQTEVFNILLPNDNLCGLQPGFTDVVCGGYWIMIKKEALSVGKHQIHSHGEQVDSFRSEVTYELTIE